MKMLRRLVLVATALIGLNAHAITTHLQNEPAPFTLDQTGAVLVGLHPAGTALAGNPGYLDLFPFHIDAPSVITGVFLLPGVLSQFVAAADAPNLATPLAFGIIDSTYKTVDVTFNFLNNSFALVTPLAKAGDYAFLSLGVSGSGLGLYGALVFAQPIVAVPEPATYVLALAGLGIVGWVASRRRTGANA